MRYVLAAMAVVLLAACQQVMERDSGPTPLDADALRETLIRNTLVRSGGPFFYRWRYYGIHRDEGIMTARVVWPGGEEHASGSWEITPDGLYCRTWNNEWGAGKRGCFKATRDGDEIVFDHVSGSSGDSQRYIYSLRADGPQRLR